MRWLVEYEYRGEQYVIAVHAESREEALERLEAIRFGNLLGQIESVIEIDGGTS